MTKRRDVEASLREGRRLRAQYAELLELGEAFGAPEAEMVKARAILAKADATIRMQERALGQRLYHGPGKRKKRR